MAESTDGWERYDIPGSDRPWFHQQPCPLDDIGEGHMHARNEDGSWGVSVVTFAQIGVTPGWPPLGATDGEAS